MKRDFRFYKTTKDEWYIDLPEWEGDPQDLQMIQGADEWLNLMSNLREVTLTVADVNFENAAYMSLVRLGEPNLGGGGNYLLKYYKNQNVNLAIWLCEVVVFIFNQYPPYIYFAVK